MKRSLLLRYAVAVVAVSLTVLLKLLLEPLVAQDAPFLLLLGAVVVGAWFGGLGPGLLATAIAALAADYLFVAPIGSFTGPGVKIVPLGLFALQGVLVSLLVAALHSARQRAEASALEAQSHQESLRESEELHRTVVEQAAENIFVIDAGSKRILEANAALSRSLGYAPEELKRLTLYDVVAHDREDIDRNIRHILEGHGFTGERLYRRKDSSLMAVEVSAGVISYRGKRAMCVVAHDVTEYKRTEEALRRSLDALLALYETGQILGSSLQREEIGSRLFEIMQRVFGPTVAVISLHDDQGRLRTWRAVGPETVRASMRDEPEARAARHAALETGKHRILELERSGPQTERVVGLFLPLRMRDRLIGLLEVYGPESLAENGVVETLTSLTSQAASALENARLYEELAERGQELHELVGRLLTTQEEERRRVAYDIHDGLAQVAAAAHQHLQAYARHHPPGSSRGREELEEALELVQQTVGEARQVISELRPTTLDDFGLAAAVRLQTEALRSEGTEVDYDVELGDERLPSQIETTLYRIAQEALTNVRKHAGAYRAHVKLERSGDVIRLLIRDDGHGFRPAQTRDSSGPGERVGLSGMRERVSLLGGRFEVQSRLGAGTSVVAEVPLLMTVGGGEDGS